jgi:hypothetical protein
MIGNRRLPIPIGDIVNRGQRRASFPRYFTIALAGIFEPDDLGISCGFCLGSCVLR